MSLSIILKMFEEYDKRRVEKARRERESRRELEQVPQPPSVSSMITEPYSSLRPIGISVSTSSEVPVITGLDGYPIPTPLVPLTSDFKLERRREEREVVYVTTRDVLGEDFKKYIEKLKSEK